MGKHDALTKTLAVFGTALVVLPLLAPLLFGLSSIGRPGGMRFDYLMPFEVYPVTLVGVALVVWASLRAHARRRAVGIAVTGMLVALVSAGIAAQLTGIANSEETLEAWRYALTAGLAAASVAAQLALAIIGGMLSRDLFVAHRDATPPLTPAAGA